MSMVKVKVEQMHGATRFSTWRNGVIHYYAMLRGTTAKLYDYFPPEMTAEEFAEYQQIEKEETDENDKKLMKEMGVDPDDFPDSNDGLTSPYVELIGTIEMLTLRDGVMPVLETLERSVVFSLADLMDIRAIMVAIGETLHSNGESH